MTSKSASNLFSLFVIILSACSTVSCTILASTPTSAITAIHTATRAQTKTAIPAATVTLTPQPSLMTMVTPRDWKSEEVEFLLVIQDTLRTDNREKLASLIHYPITISMLDESELEIENATEFIANYEKIVIPEWKDLVLAQEPSELFSNWQGAMVHRGELWFTAVCIDAACENSQFYIVAIRQIDWSN
jgi:hypothetical protein